MGSSAAVVGGLAPLPRATTYFNPPLTEQIIQMIADMQASIAMLTIAIAKLADKVNSGGGGSHMTKLTKSMVTCPKPWDGKGDSTAASHFLAAYANWAVSQKEKMNQESTFRLWIRKDIDWI
jgi:hypothetical protein